jgi:hypothetical protein
LPHVVYMYTTINKNESYLGGHHIVSHGVYMPPQKRCFLNLLQGV